MRKVVIAMKNRKDLEKIILVDNKTGNGGTAFVDETAADFCDSVFNGGNNTWNNNGTISEVELNLALNECGIYPIKFSY